MGTRVEGLGLSWIFVRAARVGHVEAESSPAYILHLPLPVPGVLAATLSRCFTERQRSEERRVERV